MINGIILSISKISALLEMNSVVIISLNALAHGQRQTVFMILIALGGM